MAYSNTKKDKIQIDWIERAKSAAILGLLVFISAASILNIIKQIKTLRNAYRQNKTLEERISDLEIDNKTLEAEIWEATSTDNINRKEREYFGIGTSGDYWLTLPPDDKFPQVKVEQIEEREEPNIIKWWKLFTK